MMIWWLLGASLIGGIASDNIEQNNYKLIANQNISKVECSLLEGIRIQNKSESQKGTKIDEKIALYEWELFREKCKCYGDRAIDCSLSFPKKRLKKVK